MAYITFENVTKVYRSGEQEVRALDGMSFTVEKGELCVIVGPSGAGKTTLLNILGGMDSVSSGSVRLGDLCIDRRCERDRTNFRLPEFGLGLKFYKIWQN